jgi:hypothetical protein
VTVDPDFKRSFDRDWDDHGRRMERMRRFNMVFSAIVFSIMFAMAVGGVWLLSHPDLIGEYIGTIWSAIARSGAAGPPSQGSRRS